MEQKVIYVMYFWKYAKVEQIGDMTELSIDIMVDYILEVGKEYFIKNKKNKLNIKNKLLNFKVVNLDKLHI